MNLKRYCKENNYCCKTCENSFLNHRYIDDPNPKLCCSFYGVRFTNEDNICMNYESKKTIEE